MSDPQEILRRAARPPSDLAAGRVLRRAEQSLDGARVRRPRWAAAALVGAATIAAATLLWPDAGPAPAGDTVPPGPTVAIGRDPVVAADGDVHLFPEGTGAWSADDTRRPRILWESGALRVEVAPGRGVDLEVETPDASVRVVGTGFTVLRDARGTRVDVAHGTVHTRCHDGREARLDAGESLECLPVTGAGMLARARALDADGADDPTVLAALEAGLRLEPGGGPVRSELAARRISVLARAGRSAEAAAAAEAWLAGPDTLRRDEIRALAVDLAVAAGDCARARTLDPTAPAAITCTPGP